MESIITYTIFGLIFGSFVTMASYRLIHGGSFWGRSKCAKCKHKLGIKDLVPVFSYLFQKGKCRYCKKTINKRYPLIELGTVLMFIGIGFDQHGFFISMLLLAMAVCLMILISTDLESFIIPDEINFALAVIGIFFAYASGYSLAQVLLSPLLLGGIGLLLKYGFKLFMQKDGLGMGDVKFFAVAGLYLTPEAISAFFFLSGVIGILISLIWKFTGRGEKFPFGPALALSLYTCLVFPESINITNFML